MATTSVHLPSDLLEDLDELARARGVSRNKLFVEACRALLAGGRPSWPPGYLEGEHLSRSDLSELRRESGSFAEDITKARRSRRQAPF